jgi:hypothetical protein
MTAVFRLLQYNQQSQASAIPACPDFRCKKISFHLLLSAPGFL